mmetsp:Transcript_8375/g.14189  ORF Transcript_8375/g.14189 Transcript_8375/m.14189 type:complete len:227 (-) Transcript_8375:288-968(-)
MGFHSCHRHGQLQIDSLVNLKTIHYYYLLLRRFSLRSLTKPHMVLPWCFLKTVAVNLDSLELILQVLHLQSKLRLYSIDLQTLVLARILSCRRLDPKPKHVVSLLMIDLLHQSLDRSQLLLTILLLNSNHPYAHDSQLPIPFLVALHRFVTHHSPLPQCTCHCLQKYCVWCEEQPLEMQSPRRLQVMHLFWIVFECRCCRLVVDDASLYWHEVPIVRLHAHLLYAP